MQKIAIMPVSDGKVEHKTIGQVHLLEHLACRVGYRANTTQLLEYHGLAAGRDAAKPCPWGQTGSSRGDT